MTEGMSFSFPSLLFHEGRTYGQPEVVPISLPQVATGLRALLRRGRSVNAAFSKTESNVAGNLCRMCRKEESRHGDFSLHSQNSRTK